MSRALACGLLLMAAPPMAAADAWSGEGPLWMLRQKGRISHDAPLRAVNPPSVGAKITRVYWRYQLAMSIPRGLQVGLCAASRCVKLPGGAGGTEAFAGVEADSAFTFSLFLPGTGPIKPPVRMLKTQVIVNYR